MSNKDYKIKVKSSFLFEHGILVTFNQNNKQIPCLQGLYSIEKHEAILMLLDDENSLSGFNQLLPPGFIKTAGERLDFILTYEDRIEYLKEKGFDLKSIDDE